MLLKRIIWATFVLIGSITFCGQNALAQSETPKLELGAHLTALRLSEFRDSEAGVGGRITFNLNDHVALEGEVNLFPSDLITDGKLQGLFGVKAGRRGDKFGLFAKARPGFMRFNRTPVICPAIFPPPLGCALASGRTEFAFDLGGVAEFYPSRSTVVRFDLGDTLIRYSDGPFIRPRGGVRNNLTSHNLQFNAGFGVRF
ncbi:MAG: outer membrane beta-barrel protein [Blastocatellia bacterium]